MPFDEVSLDSNRSCRSAPRHCRLDVELAGDGAECAEDDGCRITKERDGLRAVRCNFGSSRQESACVLQGQEWARRVGLVTEGNIHDDVGSSTIICLFPNGDLVHTYLRRGVVQLDADVSTKHQSKVAISRGSYSRVTRCCGVVEIDLDGLPRIRINRRRVIPNPCTCPTTFCESDGFGDAADLTLDGSATTSKPGAAFCHGGKRARHSRESIAIKDHVSAKEAQNVGTCDVRKRGKERQPNCTREALIGRETEDSTTAEPPKKWRYKVQYVEEVQKCGS